MSAEATRDQLNIFRQQFTQVVRVLALLQQIGVPKSHEGESGGSKTVAKAEQCEEITSKAETQPSQKLLNALTFIASGESETHDSIAIMMEIDHPGSEIRFRWASSENQSATAEERLNQVGRFLIKLLSHKPTSAAQDYIVKSSNKLLDEVLQMKRTDLSKDLGAHLAAQNGFLAELMKISKSLTTPQGKPIFPSYSTNLHPSLTEISESGSYTVGTHSAHMENAWGRLQKLIKLVRKTCNAGKGKKARRRINLPASKELLLFAHNLHSHPAFSFLLTQGRFNTSSNTLAILERLSLYQQTCIDIVSGMLDVPAIKAVKFIEVSKPESMQLEPTVDRQAALGVLTQVLQNTGNGLQEFRDFCKTRGHQERQVIAGFTQSLQKKLLTHPEITLLHFYASSSSSKPESGIGSSSPCHACYSLVKNHPSYLLIPLKTGYHIDPTWGLPLPGAFRNDDEPHKIYEVLLPNLAIQLNQELRATLESRFQSPHNSILIPMAQLEQDMRDHVFKNITAKFGADLNQSEGSEDDQESSQARDDESFSGNCAGCHDVTTGRKCSKCSKVYVCSLQCEASYEPWHIFDCKPTREIDSADYLLRFCFRDQMPDYDDDANVAGFGFDRCQGPEERCKLLGLYIGLVQSIEAMGLTPVTSRQLHQWQQSNTLAENICKVYEEVRRRRGKSGYYDWFLNNKHIVDADTPKFQVSVETGGLNFEALALWTPRAKGIRTINQLKVAFPNELEYYVAVFYACHRTHLHPSPPTQLWMDFGFCTCHLEDFPYLEERRLATIYGQLLEKCTFAEFCSAFKAEGREAIERLARKKGLGSTLMDLEHDGIYLKKPGPYTCFALKQYIAIGDPTAEPTGGVSWDYGYYGCRSARDKELWKATFRKLFQNKNHRDLDLHQACIRGRIFEYVSKILPDTPRAFQRLCTNVYPLKEY